MKSFIIAAVTAVVVLSSCSVYRSGQTPDDVYFSPAREEGAAYVQTTNDRDDGRRYNDNRATYRGYDDYATSDDRWLMMRVRNRSRWSVFDDYNYYNPYDAYGFGGWHPGFTFGYGYYDPYSYSYYNHFNNYYNWNSYYNPYYPQIIVVNPKTNPAGYTRIRNFNLSTYNNINNNNRRSAAGNPHINNRGNQGYNNTNNNRTLGNSFRRVFSNSNVNTSRDRGTYQPSQSRPVRVYTPSNNNNNNSTYSPGRSSSSSSSGTSGSSSSSGSGSRPNRR